MVKPMEREARFELEKEGYCGDRVNVVLNWSEELKRLVPNEN